MKYKYVKEELEQFWFFINERHSIYLKRKAKAKWPWTTDRVLQKYRFTNPFRQNDRVTEEWTKRYMKLYAKRKKDEDIFFHLCLFRFFNWPETYDTLIFNMRSKWNNKDAKEILRKRISEDHEKIFTGAYIITASGATGPKHEAICDALDVVYENRRKMIRRIMKRKSIEYAVEVVQEIPTQGPFTSYEIACDLYNTRLLADARDIMTYANPGPGAKRGIHRLLTGSKDWDVDYKWPKNADMKIGAKPDYIAVMRDLLVKSQKKGVLSKEVLSSEWKVDMRVIEHSLCESDKRRRVMLKEGTPRSLYHAKLNDDLFETNLPWDSDRED